MVALSARVSTFDDWIDLFYQWQKDIEYDESALKGFDFTMEPKYGELPTSEIEFGDFAGRSRWERGP